MISQLPLYLELQQTLLQCTPSSQPIKKIKYDSCILYTSYILCSDPHEAHPLKTLEILVSPVDWYH